MYIVPVSFIGEGNMKYKRKNTDLPKFTNTRCLK